MAKGIRNPVIIVILGLAVLGLIYRLATNPGGFFLGLAITALIAAGLYFLLTRLVMPRRRSGMDSGYRKALKQSKQRQKQKETTRKNNQKKKRHLKVIDGNRKR